MDNSSKENGILNDGGIISRFVAEEKRHNPITSNLERMSGQLYWLSDEDFVKKFDWFCDNNNDVELLLAYSVLAKNILDGKKYDGYDALGKKSQERIRIAIEKGIKNAKKSELLSCFKLLSDVTGRMAEENIVDDDMKFFDLINLLLNFRSGDLPEGEDSVLGKIQSDVDVVTSRFAQKKGTH